ncbi:WAPL protein, partial [Polypterus senegalus]
MLTVVCFKEVLNTKRYPQYLNTRIPEVYEKSLNPRPPYVPSHLLISVFLLQMCRSALAADSLLTHLPTNAAEVNSDAEGYLAMRFRPTQSKSKKDAKLEFFGFDEENEVYGIKGDVAASGGANYKIKYFGFDDLSESDSEEEDHLLVQDKRNSKKKAMIEAASVAFSLPPPSSQHSENDSQDSQTSSNTDILDFHDDSFPTVSEVMKRAVNKQSEKTKESTRKIFSGPKRALISTKETASRKDDGLFKAPPPPRVIKSVSVPSQPYQDIVTALKCRKEDKELYTVVQHVKHFNDVVEFGENQEFTDDFEYLQTGLKSSQPLNTRCLSIISLASKCAMPSFRMHLRAHGMVAQVFKTLNDAPQHPNLALCTASLMYILSRDRLNMDLDRASLDLMIRLLELEQDSSVTFQLNEKEINKVKEKIRKLCETVHNKHLDLENITTGHLAMETLLSLTSKRAGDWFKEELRLLGGLDHIVDKVKECIENLSCEDDASLVAALWGAERCLRVLESVTVHNPENQSYLIAYKDSQLIISSARQVNMKQVLHATNSQDIKKKLHSFVDFLGLWHCEEMIRRYNCAVSSFCSEDGISLPHCSTSCNVGKAVEDCMRAIIGVLLNLTHDNEWGSTKTGEQDSLIVTALNCVLRVPQYLPQEQRFDIRVLGLGLLINLVEYSARNRHCLMEMETDSIPCAGEDDPKPEGPVSAVTALVQLFLQRERAAVLAETETDDFIKDAPTAQLDQSGEWQETSGEIQWVASEENRDTNDKDKKEEEEEELDLNKESDFIDSDQEIKQESEKPASADQTPADAPPADLLPVQRLCAADASTARFAWDKYTDIDPLRADLAAGLHKTAWLAVGHDRSPAAVLQAALS